MKLNTAIELNPQKGVNGLTPMTNVIVDFDIEGDPDGNFATINSITTETGEIIPYSKEFDLEFECECEYQQRVGDNYLKYGVFEYDIELIKK